MKRCFLIVGILCIIVMPLVGCEGGGGGSSRSLTPETISTPSTPTGPSSGDINEVLTYSTGGSTSSLGHSVQYRFNWGDGSYSEWSSSTSASHSWSSSGNYMVQAQARSSANSDISSSWSGSKSVIINPSPITKQIVISYSSTTANHLGEYFEYLEEWMYEADPGYTYLVVSLDIKNNGYDSFSTGHYAFSVVVNNAGYGVTYVGVEDLLKVVDLLDGGRITGKLAFEVPKEVTSLGYQLKYDAFKEYNIEWIKQ